MEPLGVGVRAISETDVRAANVLVVGCGPIGLFAIAAARAGGASRVLGIDPVPFRRDLAINLGADAALDPSDTVVPSWTAEKTSGEGVEVVIETSGHPAACRSALEALSPGGTMVVASLPAGEIPIDVARHVVLREIAIRGIYGRRLDETWLAVERFLATHPAAIAPVITHRFALRDFAAAFATAVSADAGKVVFAFD